MKAQESQVAEVLGRSLGAEVLEGSSKGRQYDYIHMTHEENSSNVLSAIRQTCQKGLPFPLTILGSSWVCTWTTQEQSVYVGATPSSMLGQQLLSRTMERAATDETRPLRDHDGNVPSTTTSVRSYEDNLTADRFPSTAVLYLASSRACNWLLIS